MNELEQLATVCRCVHGNENVCEAVDGVHIAARRVKVYAQISLQTPAE